MTVMDESPTGSPWITLTVVGSEVDGAAPYWQQAVTPDLLSDRLTFTALLGMMVEKLGVDPVRFVSPWEVWEIEDGQVASVDLGRFIEYGPAPWSIP